MKLWDSLCSTLGAREVSVKDVSRKHFLELRLIHSIAYGVPWYGRWGYSFGRGCYGITMKMYEEAKKNLQNLSLQTLLGTFTLFEATEAALNALLWGLLSFFYEMLSSVYWKAEEQVKANSRVGRIIDNYVRLAAGLKEPYQLKTLGDLVRFLTEYQRIASANVESHEWKKPAGPHRNGKVGPRKGVSKRAPCSTFNAQSTATVRWSGERLEYAFKVWTLNTD